MHDTQACDPLPGQEQAFDAQAAELLQGYLRESPERFEHLLRELATRVEAQDVPQEVASTEGAFLVDDCTVVLRRNPDNDYLEIFCDVGLPHPADEHATYRTALELNLCRTYPGLTLGVHPQSGRIVATVAVHSLLVHDLDTCLATLQMVTLQVRRLQDSAVLALGDGQPD